MLYRCPSRTGCVYVYDSSVFPTRTSFTTERTAPSSPSLPDVIVHGIWNHSPISQYLPIRFQTSAAGRLTSISISTDVYVGLGVWSGAGGGAWAAAVPVNQASAMTPAT